MTRSAGGQHPHDALRSTTALAVGSRAVGPDQGLSGPAVEGLVAPGTSRRSRRGRRPTADGRRSRGRWRRRLACLLLGSLLAATSVTAPSYAAPPRTSPTAAFLCLDGLAKPQLCIQWSKQDVRRFDDLAAGVGATAATKWLCDKVPKSPVDLAVKAGCVGVLGLYFGRIIRTFQVAADKGQCVRLRFIIPPAAVNGWRRVPC